MDALQKTLFQILGHNFLLCSKRFNSIRHTVLSYLIQRLFACRVVIMFEATDDTDTHFFVAYTKKAEVLLEMDAFTLASLTDKVYLANARTIKQVVIRKGVCI